MATSKQSDSMQKELETYLALKPYIGHCLSMNHDLNNPLAGVYGYTEFLLETSDNLTDDQRKYLEQILTCAERMKKIIEALCEEKIALKDKIDLKEVAAMYEKASEQSD